MNKTDADRLRKLIRTSCYLDANGYPCTDDWINGRKVRKYLHRLIMDAPKNRQVEHRNGIKHDLRRTNLRLSNQQQNMYNKSKMVFNTSGYKGAFYRKYPSGNGYWYAKLQIIEADGKKHSYYIGNLDTKEDAARAYNKLALEHFGKYARLNVIPKK